MLNYVWTEDYSVNNLILDDHHKNLFRLFNEAYSLIVTDSPSYLTLKLISELKVYTIFHFNEEEKLMQHANYPDYDEHIKEHAGFVEKIESLKTSMTDNNPREINEELFIFLSEWLINHIQKLDKAYIGKI
jgi:hemerythrin